MRLFLCLYHNRRRRSLLSIIVSTAVILLLPAGYSSAAGCPNEVLRSQLHSVQLPDCRAYELVSPAAKNGSPVTVTSADSSHVIINSISGFAGSNQHALLNFYYINRLDPFTPGAGWSTQAFEEPAEFDNIAVENLVAESRDSTKGLFNYRSHLLPVSGESNIYIRNLPNGDPIEIGPGFSSAVLAANATHGGESISTPSASVDLTHVLFAIAGASPISNAGSNYLWPGDSTVENTGPQWGEQGFVSLYEYVGKGNSEPKLVGVSNKGALRSNLEAHLISQCGTALGFPSEGIFARGNNSDEANNAISADGSRVFFTAAAATQGISHNACTGAGVGYGPPVNELFARVDGSQTVAISEPSRSDCSACSLGEPAGAIFQGASEDGSRVFFLSEQHLLEGSKGTDLYEYDFGAEEGDRVTLVAPNVLGVARVSSKDGSRVYFVAQEVLTGANREGMTPVAGAPNLYVSATVCPGGGSHCGGPSHSTTFVGTLATGDEAVWRQEDRRTIDTTPDGRFAVFASSAALTPGDMSSVAQVFEYDAETESLARVSVGENGFNNNGNTEEFPAAIVSPNYSGHQNPAPRLTSVSDDGSYIVFQSRAALTPQAAEGFVNVYEYHAGQVSLISDGQDRSSQQGGFPSTSLLGLDGSGGDIFFETADRLTPQDGDTQIDVYDARIDGGFAPSLPLECNSGCQGPFSPAPQFPVAASMSQPAGEQLIESPSTLKAANVKKTKRKRKVRHATRHRAKARGGGVRRAGGSPRKGR